jgi:RNA polymerase sigma factor (sigma-70 family)
MGRVGESTHPSLLSRVRSSADDQAWRDFDARYRSLIVRYCRARRLQSAEADDVRQIVMLSLAKYLRSFRYKPELGRFRDYLRRVVENAIRRYSTNRDRHSAALIDSDHLDLVEDQGPPGHEKLWEEEWVRHHYRQALAVVREHSSPQSVAVFQEFLSGRTPESVAEQFSMSLQAVYQVRQRMRKRLQDQIARQLHDEEFPERNSSASPH